MQVPQDCPRNIYRTYWPSMPELFDLPCNASNTNAAAVHERDALTCEGVSTVKQAIPFVGLPSPLVTPSARHSRTLRPRRQPNCRRASVAHRCRWRPSRPSPPRKAHSVWLLWATEPWSPVPARSRPVTTPTPPLILRSTQRSKLHAARADPRRWPSTRTARRLDPALWRLNHRLHGQRFRPLPWPCRPIAAPTRRRSPQAWWHATPAARGICQMTCPRRHGRRRRPGLTCRRFRSSWIRLKHPLRRRPRPTGRRTQESPWPAPWRR
jgi:hypothetical protein